jgi:peptidoglycan/xylan/chitin deacetylase (PgdA/CDA1 family)
MYKSFCLFTVHVITPKQLPAFLRLREPLPKKSVMITIDDGYGWVYEIAYPVIKKYGVSATFFVYIFTTPFGRTHPPAISMTPKAGYPLAVTVDRGECCL